MYNNLSYNTERPRINDRTKRTPVDMYGRRFLELRNLKQVVVDEVVVACTASSVVGESVAHATRAVVVADRVATNRVRFTVVTADSTFVNVFTADRKFHSAATFCMLHYCVGLYTWSRRTVILSPCPTYNSRRLGHLPYNLPWTGRVAFRAISNIHGTSEQILELSQVCVLKWSCLLANRLSSNFQETLSF